MKQDDFLLIQTESIVMLKSLTTLVTAAQKEQGGAERLFGIAKMGTEDRKRVLRKSTMVSKSDIWKFVNFQPTPCARILKSPKRKQKKQSSG